MVGLWYKKKDAFGPMLLREVQKINPKIKLNQIGYFISQNPPLNHIHLDTSESEAEPVIQQPCNSTNQTPQTSLPIPIPPTTTTKHQIDTSINSSIQTPAQTFNIIADIHHAPPTNLTATIQSEPVPDTPTYHYTAPTSSQPIQSAPTTPNNHPASTTSSIQLSQESTDDEDESIDDEPIDDDSSEDDSDDAVEPEPMENIRMILQHILGSQFENYYVPKNL